MSKFVEAIWRAWFALGEKRHPGNGKIVADAVVADLLRRKPGK